MYGNYGSNKGEANAGKGFYARLGWESKTAYVEANGGEFAPEGDFYLNLTAFFEFKTKLSGDKK